MNDQSGSIPEPSVDQPAAKRPRLLHLDSSPEAKKIRPEKRAQDKDIECVTISSSEDDGNDELVIETKPKFVIEATGGLHTNDTKNVSDKNGNIIVNVNREVGEAPTHLAPQLARMFKPHQIGGIRFLYDNIIERNGKKVGRKKRTGVGCILAHSMGLGKTLQVVALCDIFLRHTQGKHILCIVPINTIQNWSSEFDHWVPKQADRSKLSRSGEIRPRNFDVLNLDGLDFSERIETIFKWWRVGGVLLMGYELYRLLANKKFEDFGTKGQSTFKRLLKCLVNPGPDLLVCDEGHRLKNPKAHITKTLKSIKTRQRIVLTGYPLQNNLMEYWCMVDFVRPKFLGTEAEFAYKFEAPITQKNESSPEARKKKQEIAHILVEKLNGVIQRRGPDDLKSRLPKRSEHTILVRMTPIQRKLYNACIKSLGGRLRCIRPVEAHAACLSVINHPDIVMQPLYSYKDSDVYSEWADPFLSEYTLGRLENSAKFKILFHILEETLKVGDRLLLFSQLRRTLNMIEVFLQKRLVIGTTQKWRNGRDYFRLDGTLSSSKRQSLITAFNSSAIVKLFIITTRAGSPGINLIGANRVIILDASWNPCHDSQAAARIFRFGQTKPCHVYRMVMDNSIERRIYNRQIDKQGLSDRIVDKKTPELLLSEEDLKDLIRYDEEDPPRHLDLSESAEKYEDHVLQSVVRTCGKDLTRAPLSHDALLIDRKDLRLTKAEKKNAEKKYLMEQGVSTLNKPTSSYLEDDSDSRDDTEQGTSFKGTQLNTDNRNSLVRESISSSQSWPNTAVIGATLAIHPDVLTDTVDITSSPSRNLPNQGFEQSVTLEKIKIPRAIDLCGHGMQSIQLAAEQEVKCLKTPYGSFICLPGSRILKLKDNKIFNIKGHD